VASAKSLENFFSINSNWPDKRHQELATRFGYCRGKGGSLHIADLGVGMLGANGIVGA